MLNCIIIDDEINSRKMLSTLIDTYCDNAKVLAMGSSVDEGLELIEKYKPDVVFLDIEMPFKNGFDLLASIKEISFKTVFTSAHSHYAIKAIKFSAIDYLLKPVSINELKDALLKIEQEDDYVNKVTSLQHGVFLSNLQNLNNQLQKIVIKTIEGFEVVELKDIVRCEGDRNYTNFHFIGKRVVMVSKTLREFENLFVDYDFMRVHQSHLINLNHVRKYVKGRGGYAEMSDGTTIDIARDRKDAFVERFENYLPHLQ